MLQEKIVDNLDDRSRNYIKTIFESTRRMGTLIDDLLSFSKMGRVELSKSEVDVGGLVREVIQELEPEAKGRNINWQISEIPKVTADHAMLLRMAMVNLISNALKFTKPRPQAEIEIGCKEDQEHEIIIYIRDNGVGFDNQYAHKLFGVFQRLHRKEDFEGTGIGLANVQRIITRHGGRIWAEGVVDQGAVFYFFYLFSICFLL